MLSIVTILISSAYSKEFLSSSNNNEAYFCGSIVFTYFDLTANPAGPFDGKLTMLLTRNSQTNDINILSQFGDEMDTTVVDLNGLSSFQGPSITLSLEFVRETRMPPSVLMIELASDEVNIKSAKIRLSTTYPRISIPRMYDNLFEFERLDFDQADGRLVCGDILL